MYLGSELLPGSSLSSGTDPPNTPLTSYRRSESKSPRTLVCFASPEVRSRVGGCRFHPVPAPSSSCVAQVWCFRLSNFKARGDRRHEGVARPVVSANRQRRRLPQLHLGTSSAFGQPSEIGGSQLHTRALPRNSYRHTGVIRLWCYTVLYDCIGGFHRLIT